MKSIAEQLAEQAQLAQEKLGQLTNTNNIQNCLNQYLKKS